MGVTERKEREKLELRKQILDTAMKLFVEQGYDKTSIRNIAEQIEYSPGTIYLHFKDKADIFLELHTMAFEELFHALAGCVDIKDPLERLHWIGKTYLEFAIANPDLYDLMFILKEPMEAMHQDCEWKEGFKTYDLLRDTILDGIAQGVMKVKDPDVVCMIAWSQAHGLASLLIRQRFKMLPPETVETMMFESLKEMCQRIGCDC